MGFTEMQTQGGGGLADVVLEAMRAQRAVPGTGMQAVEATDAFGDYPTDGMGMNMVMQMMQALRAQDAAGPGPVNDFWLNLMRRADDGNGDYVLRRNFGR